MIACSFDINESCNITKPNSITLDKQVASAYVSRPNKTTKKTFPTVQNNQWITHANKRRSGLTSNCLYRGSLSASSVLNKDTTDKGLAVGSGTISGLVPLKPWTRKRPLAQQLGLLDFCRDGFGITRKPFGQVVPLYGLPKGQQMTLKSMYCRLKHFCLIWLGYRLYATCAVISIPNWKYKYWYRLIDIMIADVGI